MIDKHRLLHVAELIDAFRLVPRLSLFMAFYISMISYKWYMALPDPTTPQSIVLTSISGLLTATIGLYNSSGRQWGKS